MDFAVALATSTESWRPVVRAEALGFRRAWFYDTQLLNPDVFVGMALAAERTERIRLGTGVLIPSNRIAPVAANGFATLNRLAPGRIDFGVGTGFTGRRTMGMGAIRLADLERYVLEVRGLLAGKTVDAVIEGAPRRMRFLNPELGLIHLDDPVPLHVSAMGPKSRRSAARLGGGWLNFTGSDAGGLRDLEDWRDACVEAGRDPDAAEATLFLLGAVLAPGEGFDSPRAVAQAGPYVAVMLHNLVETSEAGSLHGHVPDFLADAVEAYRKVHAGYDPEAPWLENHRGHLMFLREEECALMTPELIRHFTFTDTRDRLVERLGALGEAGYGEIAVQLVHGHEDAIEDWAQVAAGLDAPGAERTVDPR